MASQSKSKSHNAKAERFFTLVTARPKAVMFTAFMLIISCAVFIPGIVKDTRSEVLST